MKSTRPPPSAGFPGLLLFLVVLLCLPAAGPLQAQGNRISLGYEVRGYLSAFEENPAFVGAPSSLIKGGLRVGYVRYLSGPLFASGGLFFQLQDDEDAFFGGPLSFDAWHLEGGLGLQFDRLSVSGSLRAERFGEIRIRAAEADGSTAWLSPSSRDALWAASAVGGVGYFLLPFLEARAELTLPLGSSASISPPPGSTAVPAVRSANLGAPTLSVGLSVSVPFGRPRPMAGPRGGASGVGRPPNPPEAPSGAPGFVDPVDGPTLITAGFGDGRGHQGVDIDTGPGDPVYAAAAGEVVRAGTEPRYGKVVELRHAGGYATVYAHLSAIEVELGQRVDRGKRIGRAGSSGRATGNHLHFEVLLDGEHVDPETLVPFR